MNNNITPHYIFSVLPRYFVPKKAKSRELTITYKIRGYNEENQFWTVYVKNGECYVKEEAATQYNAKVIIELQNYPLLICGIADPLRIGPGLGFIRYDGSTLAHMELNTFFDFPTDLGIKYI